MLRRLARVITASDYLRGRVLDGVATPDRDPVVLPNCLDLSELPPPRRRERLILFAGRVVPTRVLTLCLRLRRSLAASAGLARGDHRCRSVQLR